MGTRFCEEAQMNGRRISKLVHEGTYVAEVDVESIRSPRSRAHLD